MTEGQVSEQVLKARTVGWPKSFKSSKINLLPIALGSLADHKNKMMRKSPQTFLITLLKALLFSNGLIKGKYMENETVVISRLLGL